MHSLPTFGRLAAGLLALLVAPPVGAQELPLSGVTGFDLFYVTNAAGTHSRLAGTNVHRSSTVFQFGPEVPGVPSRWAHRRRTLGGLETRITLGGRGLFLTPMGDAPGNGAIHMIDMRGATTASRLVATQNPAAYDLAVDEELHYVFSAEDDGLGGTTLRGYSYQTVGDLTPLTPPTIQLPSPPAAYVNRIGVDADAHVLHVPTAFGVHVIELSPTAPQMSVAASHALGATAVTTNPSSFLHEGQRHWIVGTSTFNGSQPDAAGYFAWTRAGASGTDVFGPVPNEPGKEWIPGAGTHELAVVSDGTDAYAYYLLREPAPGTFFIKPSAIGVVRFLAGASPVVSTIPMTEDVGEPFALPAVSGTRVAFESSFGPPFSADPPGGGEKISILYTPLDPLGAGSADGVLGVPAPLGGRISTRGMDRPIWSRDGRRVMAATSHFPGAPNPGVPGLEVLDVPPDVPLDRFAAPRTVVANLGSPNQSVRMPARFEPRFQGPAAPLANLSFFGNAFHQGLASVALPSYGAVGQLQDTVSFGLPAAVPGFPSVLPPTFGDAAGSSVAIPDDFGARRVTFNFAPGPGLTGLTMSAAKSGRIVVQPTMANVLAAFGVGVELDPISVDLPTGYSTTTEFLSL